MKWRRLAVALILLLGWWCIAACTMRAYPGFIPAGDSQNGSGGGADGGGDNAGAGDASSAGDTVPAVDLTSNLIGYWKLDETSGTTIVDSAGGDNNGTLVGAAAILPAADSVLGGAIAFDGNLYFTLAGTAAAKPVRDITVSAWVKANVSAEMGFLRSADSDGWVSGWRLVTDGSWDFNFRVNTDAALPPTVATAYTPTPEHIVAGVWQHVVGVYDGTEVMMYLDGKLVHSASLSGNIIYPTPGDGDSLLGISNGVAAMDGAMDEVRLYDRALSAAEVEALCRLVPIDVISNLELHWKLDETSGDAQDASGNGHVGTTTGAGWLPVGGVVDGALDHDSATDVVELNAATALDALGETITVAMWVKKSGVITDGFASPIWKSDFSTGWAFNRSDPTDDLEFRIDTSGGNNQVSCCLMGVFDGAWHHIAMVLDNGTVRGYKGGALEIDDTYVPGGGFATTALLTMSADHVTRDEVRIYSRALNGVELRALPGL